MDDVLQDLQAESLKKEIEKLRETVGRSAVDDSDATSDDDERAGALHVDSDDSAAARELSTHNAVHDSWVGVRVNEVHGAIAAENSVVQTLKIY